jgi:hypothetical protein
MTIGNLNGINRDASAFWALRHTSHQNFVVIAAPRGFFKSAAQGLTQ